MGKAQKEKRKQQKASPLQRAPATKAELLPPEDRVFSVASFGLAWRWTVVFLLEICSKTLKEVADLVKKRPMECAKWANRLWKDGSVEDLGRSGRVSEVSSADLEAIKAELARSLPGTSLKVVLKRLKDGGNFEGSLSEERYRVALNDSGWSHQKVVFVLPLNHATMDKRWAFAVKYRNVGLGNKAIFTDSKYFHGGEIEPRSKKVGFCSWAPDGEPRTIVKTQGSNYQVHVYGGVCKYGMTNLTVVSGTTGLADAYKYSRDNPFY